MKKEELKKMRNLASLIRKHIAEIDDVTTIYTLSDTQELSYIRELCAELSNYIGQINR